MNSNEQGRASERARLALGELDRIAESLERRFKEGRRVLSFQQYLELFASNPARFGRDAARYVRDMFDHYGTVPVARPWGERVRYRLFDLPWEHASAAAGGSAARPPREAALVGNEELQAELYRALSNFVREGRANRLVLMHGPNGSAKSTAAACVLRALENYSTLDEGAVYRFHWVFPSRKTTRGAIGFGGSVRPSLTEGASYAHLPDEEIEARLVIELRDHPLFLLPQPERRELLERVYADAGLHESPPEWLLNGKLSYKNQQVFEALLVANHGSLAETLRHVQVERWFMSRRYRAGAVTLGPALSVDASERQITADRSLASLPTSLQATPLFEAHGELIDASGGVLEFSDLLKRPIDAYRYLQLTLETGEVQLTQQTVQTNVVMVGSANDVHLAAFRDHHEYPSFRGRFEFVRVPYLRVVTDEQRIYDTQIAPYLDRHVAPHATRVASQFAVLTRMRQPEAKRYPPALASIVASLGAVEKMDLYSTGAVPERLDGESQKLLRASVGALYYESDSGPEYEGRVGVSAREIRTVLLDAAQSAEHPCLSPFAVLQALDDLCRRTADYDWLREKPLAGGYHDHRMFREVLRTRLLDELELEMRAASGLVDEVRYGELFERYLSQVGAWVKGERVRNPHTGQSEPADERLMREVEARLGVAGKPDDHRRGLISTIAAWAIDHPGEKIVNAVVFSQPMRKLRESVFSERRRGVALVVRDMATVLHERRQSSSSAPGGSKQLALGDEARRQAEEAYERLQGVGYCQHCALDAASALLRGRYADLIP